jgi:integrase
MPSSRQYLVQRATTWHCRIDIPADLRPAFGNRRILSTSLKTGDKQLAKELAAAQVGQWKAQFRSLREARARRGDSWKANAATIGRGLNEATRAHKIAVALDEPAPYEESSLLQPELVQALQAQFADPEYAEALQALAEHRAAEGMAGQVALRDDIRDIVAALFQEAISQGEALSPVESEELESLLSSPGGYKPKSPISASAQTQFASYLAEQNDNQRTRDVYLSHIKRLSNWLTTNGRELTFDTVADYLNTVSKVRQTRLGHLAALRKFHKWAVRYDAYYRDLLADKRSPFEGHEHPKVGANAGKSWIAYSRQEAEQLHAAAVAKDDPDLADLIAFACLTGCRIEELGRIRQETTIFDSAGQPIGFRVDESKTASGIREIPLHPALLPIYTRRLQKPHGATLALFPGNDKTKAGIRLNALSQRFTKLKRAEGFGDQHVFHSLRKCTATMLQQAGVSPLTIPFILGHDVGNVTFDIYSAGPTFEQKLSAISALSFDFR